MKIKIIVFIYISLVTAIIWFSFTGPASQSENGSGEINDRQILGFITPHHDLAAPIIDRIFSISKESNIEYDTIVIFAPYHAANDIWVRTARKSWVDSGSIIFPNQEIVDELFSIDFVMEDEAALSSEHAISTLLPFIRKYYPNAKIVPVIFPRSRSLLDLQLVSQKISFLSSLNTLFVLSADFSHYLPSVVTPEKDVFTWRLFEDRSYVQILNLSNDYLDAPAAAVSFLFALDQRASDVSHAIIDHTDSSRLIGRPLDSSTSYFTAIYFSKK